MFTLDEILVRRVKERSEFGFWTSELGPTQTIVYPCGRSEALSNFLSLTASRVDLSSYIEKREDQNLRTYLKYLSFSLTSSDALSQPDLHLPLSRLVTDPHFIVSPSHFHMSSSQPIPENLVFFLTNVSNRLIEYEVSFLFFLFFFFLFPFFFSHLQFFWSSF